MQQSVTHVITTIEMGGAEKQLLVLVEQQLRSGLRVEVIYLKGRPELEENFKSVASSSKGNLAIVAGFLACE